MLSLTTIITLALSIIGTAAIDCPADRFPDCCATYGFASPDTMKNTFNVPDDKIPDGVVPVGYVCMGMHGCENHGLQPRCCKGSWKSWGGAGRLGIDCV